MDRATNVLVLCGFLALAYFFLSSSFSPLSGFDPVGNLPDRIDDVYLNFDTLRTDLADYRWPTDASRKMSSAFASFRTMHFHAGIDVSTNGRTGYRVFASRDGYISRISVSPYGYGKMLHVKHHDGFTTVYAHLGGFNEEIEAYVREQQYGNGHYGIEAEFDKARFPVAKGAVIAYTGDTGIGPAHFHFEIRDERMNPVNPLLCPDFASTISDTRYPEFQQVSFAPYDYASRVNGSAAPVVHDVRRIGNRKYALSRVVHIDGSAGISVKGSDQADATWQRSNIYRYELYLDSTLLFTATHDRFSAKETEQIAIHYDWSLLQSGEGRFQKLFLEPGNNLPLYSRLPERAGVLSSEAFSRGEHQLRIIASDIAGNTSELTAHIVFEDPPSIDVRKIEKRFVLIPQSTTDLQSITIGSRLPGRKNWKLTTYDPSTLDSAGGGLILPIDADSPQHLRIMARDGEGSQSYPVFFAPVVSRSSNTSLTLKKEFIRDYLLVTITSHLPFTLRPSVWIVEQQRRTLLDISAADERTYVGTIPLSFVQGGTLRLEANGMVNGAAVEAYDEFSIFPIVPEEGGTIVAGNGEFVVDFPAYGVYQPLYCRVEKKDDGYSVLPRDVLLNLGASVYYRSPAGEAPVNLGLYHSETGGFDLLSTTLEGEMLKGRVRNLLGDFTIREDAQAPVITNVRVRASKNRLTVTARLIDYRSGVAANSIRMTLDDRLLIASFDPYNHTLKFDEPISVQKGSHVLRIEADDKMGNKAVASKSFRTSS